jgi:hypothetical protein
MKTTKQPTIDEILEKVFEKAKEERSKAFPPSWDWSKDGNTFLGKILRVREIKLSDRVSKVYECVMLNGEVRSLWDGPRVLRRLLEEKAPKVGDIIAVRNLGRPKGKRYYDFLLAVNPEGITIEEASKGSVEECMDAIRSRIEPGRAYTVDDIRKAGINYADETIKEALNRLENMGKAYRLPTKPERWFFEG